MKTFTAIIILALTGCANIPICPEVTLKLCPAQVAK